MESNSWQNEKLAFSFIRDSKSKQRTNFSVFFFRKKMFTQIPNVRKHKQNKQTIDSSQTYHSQNIQRKFFSSNEHQISTIKTSKRNIDRLKLTLRKWNRFVVNIFGREQSSWMVLRWCLDNNWLQVCAITKIVPRLQCCLSGFSIEWVKSVQWILTQLILCLNVPVSKSIFTAYFHLIQEQRNEK